MCVCVCVCVCACVRACVGACVRACACACVHVRKNDGSSSLYPVIIQSPYPSDIHVR